MLDLPPQYSTVYLCRREGPKEIDGVPRHVLCRLSLVAFLHGGQHLGLTRRDLSTDSVYVCKECDCGQAVVLWGSLFLMLSQGGVESSVWDVCSDAVYILLHL